MSFRARWKNQTKRRARISFLFFLARHLPRCQIGVLAGLLSTSHFRLTDIPSTIGIPKPGKRVIANDGVSETGIKQLVSMPRCRCTLISQRNIKKRETEREKSKAIITSDCYITGLLLQADQIKIT